MRTICIAVAIQHQPLMKPATYEGIYDLHYSNNSLAAEKRDYCVFSASAAR